MDAVNKAQLLDTRFDKITAERGPNATEKRGLLNFVVSTKLLDVHENNHQAIARVQLDVTGMPKGETSPDAFAFKVSVAGEGLYDWPGFVDRPNLDSDLVLRLLCQPIYTLAVSEVSGLARRMGISGVNLPSALEQRDEAAKRSAKRASSGVKPSSPKSKTK